MSRAVVVGSGVGGLAAAVRLAKAGMHVTVLERAAHLGGKLREVEVGGQKVVAGPSVLTMRAIFEELFDGRLSEYLELHEVDPLCRHFFPDGSVLDLYSDAARSRDAIERFADRKNADGYLSFRKRAAKIYDVVRGPFMENPLPSVMDLMNPFTLLQMTQIDGMRTLWKALGEFFPDPRLQQLFARYATYNGSNPFLAPATLSVIAHVENAFGIFACKGGITRLADALVQRATELGVTFRTNAEVTRVLTVGDRTTGVECGGETIEADTVFLNCDVAQAYQLLPNRPAVQKRAKAYRDEELSLSAYLLLCTAKPPALDIVHHNVFFSHDYRHEFEELSQGRRPPLDPTVYLCAEDRADGGGLCPPESTREARNPLRVPATIDRAVGVEKRRNPEPYFFLTNAPPLDDRSRVSWAAEAPKARQRIIDVLKRHGWQLETTAERQVTPLEFAELFPGSRGAIYGLASNSKLAAFKRQPNQLSGLSGLYFVGGSVHPGAGLPMVALSAKIATELALKNNKRGIA